MDEGFQRLLDKSVQRAKLAADQKYRTRVKKLCDIEDGTADNVYLHPTALDPSRILSGKLPETLVQKAVDDGVVFFRTTSPRELWCMGRSAPSGATIAICFGEDLCAGLSIWKASETETEDLWTLLHSSR